MTGDQRLEPAAKERKFLTLTEAWDHHHPDRPRFAHNRTREWGVMSWSSSSLTGVWWLGIGRFRVIVNSPRHEPLFSERHGLITTLRLPRGWRVKFRTV